MIRSRLRRASVFLGAFVAALAVTAAVGAWTMGNFQANCNTATPSQVSVLTRDGAQSYANVARYEGYQWGGGCWNNNDVDEGYGDPTMDTGTRGEGGDCSGLTFKTWRESSNVSDGARYYWGPLRNVHGPYSAEAFKNGYGAPNGTVYKPYAAVMDAFASTTHVGMVFFRETSGADQIVEAKCELCGTNIFTETYRSQSAYGGARRIGWTG